MKKILTAVCLVSLAIAIPAMAADTYTGALVETLNNKINTVAAPVVNTEKALNEKQKAAQELKQKQIADKKAQIEAKQKAQQELVNKKKQQIQATKDAFKQEKNEIKSIFSVQ